MNKELVILLLNAATIFGFSALIAFAASYLIKWFTPKANEGDKIIENKRPWYFINKVEIGFLVLNLVLGFFNLYPDIPSGILAGACAAVAWYLVLTIPNLFKKI